MCVYNLMMLVNAFVHGLLREMIKRMQFGVGWKAVGKQVVTMCW